MKSRAAPGGEKNGYTEQRFQYRTACGAVLIYKG